MKKKAVFVDSDGVINTAIVRDVKAYSPTTVAELVIPDEVKPALERLKKAGFLLLCVTNKPDVARGLMTQENVDAIVAKFRRELPLDDIFLCMSPDTASPCYKPNPGLLLEGEKKYNVDLKQSYMIGDRFRDVGAGQNAGCKKTIWINRHYNEPDPNPPADFTASSLTEAVDWLLAQEKEQK
jgi:D-glycero-D-manno-heptose 1,7-bisphosphate phosphatase